MNHKKPVVSPQAFLLRVKGGEVGYSPSAGRHYHPVLNYFGLRFEAAWREPSGLRTVLEML